MRRLKLIIAQTPFRMSFFGGGTDIPDYFIDNGGAVISSSIDKYCYVNVKKLSPFFDYRNELVYSKIERVGAINEIEHPAIREAMRHWGLDGIRLTYEADLPARSGLGTSSSFAVGMINAFYALKGQYVSKRMLADNAIYLERSLCNEAGGLQDQIAAAFGGLNKITFWNGGYKVEPIVISKERKKNLNDSLMLFFTGLSRFSSDIQAETLNAIQDKKQQIKEMHTLVGEAERALVSTSPIYEFGRLLDYTWKLKRGINKNISTSIIDALYEKAISAGAVGGKLLGAGGGGFLLFFVDIEHQPKVREALKELMYVPFKFENKGSNIIYFEPEDVV